MLTDFTGFTFDGVHSSELNILRVSDGDRYNEDILPELEDKTVETNGKDGVYYYGSFYSSRNIEIQIAFDSVTEEQYRNIRRLFGQKKICKLIFDERPYKVFYVKVASPITLETICFDEDEYEWDTTGHRSKEKTEFIVDDPTINVGTALVGQATLKDQTSEWHYEDGVYIPGSIDHKVYTGKKRRIYKGEGSISFIAYDPFARQLYKTLDAYEVNGYDNVNEWAASSGILSEEEYNENKTDEYQTIESEIGFTANYNGMINVYNPSDLDVPYWLFIPFVNKEIKPGIGENIIIATDGVPDLIIEPFERADVSENGILINTRAELIEGVHYDYNMKTWRVSGSIYNRYIKGGKFGKILKGNRFGFRDQGIYLNCEVGDEVPAIFYNYLYY